MVLLKADELAALRVELDQYRRLSGQQPTGELARRRAELGPLYRPAHMIDKAALARWVQTGASQ